MFDAVNDMMEAFVGRIQRVCPFGRVYIGPLPAGPGVSVNMEHVTMKPLLDGSGLASFTLALKCKHEDMLMLAQALWNAQKALTSGEGFPAGEEWSVLTVRPADLPRVTGREIDNTWVAGSNLNVTVLFHRKP